MDNIEYLKPSLRKPQKRRDKRLGKEVIECSRYAVNIRLKGSYKNKVRKQCFVHAKKHENMKFIHDGGTKYFTDNLQLLIRFLNTHQGKNWNKLYSELCDKLDKRTVPGLHVFNHLWDFVFNKVRIENKKVYCLQYGRIEELLSRSQWPKFYVHPKTGQLCKAKKAKRR